MIEINLVPDIKLELLRAQKARSLVIMICSIVSIAAVAIVALLVLYIYSAQLIRGNIADTTITDEGEKLSSVEDLSKMLTIQNQLSKISQLNDSKKVHSRIFNLLDNINPPSPNDVSISSLNVDSITKTISIDGQAINGYSALEIFKKTIIGAKVSYKDSDKNSQDVNLASNVSTKDVSYGEDSSGIKVLRFTISFNYAEEVFAVSSTDALVYIAISGNVTDSYRGIPRSIFTDRATDLNEDK
jgi:hypothetical protein